MHQHVIAAAHAAAAAPTVGSERGLLAIALATLVFVGGMTFSSRKKRPSTGR
jgi:hypothetical protein